MRSPVFASLSLAFVSFGDAFLYPFLPLYHNSLGVPAIWVGILLSVNRFVRIFINTWMVHLIAKHGLRMITIFAVAIAILSTAGYSLAASVFMWLVLRIIWGIAFSALRLSTLGYSLQQQQIGFALGLTRGIQEAGPMLALIFTPLLLSYFNATNIFLLLSLLSLPAVYFAWMLPQESEKILPGPGKQFNGVPTSANLITFSSSFVVDGVLIVALGSLFLKYNHGITLVAATSLAAFYLAYRRVCLVLIAPLGGWMADMFGLKLIFNFSLWAMILGLLLVTNEWIEIGALITFFSYSIHSAVTPGYVVHHNVNSLSLVAENATWRDVGAALGTLAGGLLLTSNYVNVIVAVGMTGLAFLLLSQYHLRLLTLWR